MQHEHGKPLNRSTEWRRHQRFLKYGGQSRRGRRWVSDYQDEGFLGFAATVISLINKNGSVRYGELEIPESDGTRAYRKDDTTDEIYGQLAKSGFPPAMLAVAACLIGKLNSKARRGAKPTNPMPHERAFSKLKLSGDRITVENFEIALRREKFLAVLRANHTTKADREKFLAEAAKSGFKEKWVIDYLMQYETPPDRRARDLAPSAASSKGTPPQSVDYIHGAKLTRQMASYWRKHSRFTDCLRFLKPLLKRELPKVPSDEGWRMPYDYYMNGEIQTWYKVRQLEKQSTQLEARPAAGRAA